MMRIKNRAFLVIRDGMGAHEFYAADKTYLPGCVLTLQHVGEQLVLNIGSLSAHMFCRYARNCER